MNANPVTVLVVDDEPQMVEIIKFALETQGFQTITAGSAEEGWEIAQNNRLDLLVLDVMLPGRSGLSLCRRVREVADTPVLFLTARGEAPDRLEGFEAGGDDYVVKPFNPRELALRAQAIIRRANTSSRQKVVQNGPLAVDLVTGRVSLDGVDPKLTDTESKLLAVLAENLGQTVTSREIIARVWDTDSLLGSREMLKTAIYRLRVRLGDHGEELVRSIRGKGYAMPQLSEDNSGPDK